MAKVKFSETSFLSQCQHLSVSGIRKELQKSPDINREKISGKIESVLNQRIGESIPDLNYLQSLSTALIALLPSSYEAVIRILSARSPNAIYEVQFSMFVLLEKADFNQLERDGIELLLEDYLMDVPSTAAYAAWKAGLVLGFQWRSTRTERRLRELIKDARFPAGRLGAINGYAWLLNQRKTFSSEELAPLRMAGRNDPSAKVRQNAKFHLGMIKKERIG